ncbi:biotin transporter BioY [Paenibacillus wynnii]|uniref:biotin transporter BioY n=1 Tax=Paenibacillus wynnii TaxID=268407 RepID=UPI00278FD15B|nr:biotin transporter BioY [Paenibacillus wynnii]MDQ0192340.1 biotin transport system substrate-specific component [Paenibacillus wynnii]
MKEWSIRGLVFSALFAGVMISLSFMKISLPFSTVPITLQTLAVMLAGSVLGARYGTLAVLIVIGLCAAGFPVMGGKGGVSVLTGFTAGYIWSWPFAAFLIGWFAERMSQTKYTVLKLIVVNFVFGSLLVYPGGVSWLAYTAHIDSLSGALVAGMWPFLPGDLTKAVIVSGVVAAVWKVYPIERILNVKSSTWQANEKSIPGRL